jgi:hypothetical protein
MVRKRKRVDEVDDLENRVKVIGGLLRVSEILDPDRERVLDQARRLRQCHNEIVLMRSRRKGEEWRAGEAKRRRARQAEIERSVEALRDRQQSADRFHALLGRRLHPGR